MKYIKTYADNAAYEADTTKRFPHVGYLKDTKEVVYVKEKPDYSHDYLTFEALESTKFRYAMGGTNADMYYSLDGGDTWVGFGSLIDTPTVNAGDTIMFKRTRSGDGASSKYITFMSSGTFNAMGNPLSIIKGDNFETNTLTSSDAYALQKLFSGCTGLISAEKLALPATTLSQNCYYSMFEDCTALTTPPELPATTMIMNCYNRMLNGCTSLTTAPELPATTLNGDCYSYMFYNCTSLTTAPELPAATLTNYCYNSMFLSCTSLNHIKMLATNISASGCLQTWVQNVASTGTFVKDASMTTLPTGANGIPSGWTVIDA